MGLSALKRLVPPPFLEGRRNHNPLHPACEFFSTTRAPRLCPLPLVPFRVLPAPPLVQAIRRRSFLLLRLLRCLLPPSCTPCGRTDVFCPSGGLLWLEVSCCCKTSARWSLFGRFCLGPPGGTTVKISCNGILQRRSVPVWQLQQEGAGGSPHCCRAASVPHATFSTHIHYRKPRMYAHVGSSTKC